MRPQPPAAGTDQIRIPHRQLVLPNGLTLLVHEDHSVPIVAVNLWYHVGSRDEKRGRTGFAHLFEHFFFNGSENHPGGFREAMDDLGASNRNGTTNTDRTNFYEDVPAAALARTLFLEADRMGWLAGVLSQEMLDRERGVVKNEKRQNENQPYGRVFSRIVEMVYPREHPYSWPTIGHMDDLDAATLEDVKEWHRTYYGPDNCVLSLAGDVSFEEASEMALRYFGPISSGSPLTRLASWVPRLDRDRRDTMEDRVPQARIHRVWHAPAWGSDGLVDLGLAASVLASGRSSRLEKRLVYEKELATSVSASVIDREIASLFIVSVTLKPGGDLGAAEQEMEEVLAELLEKGPSQEDLRRARSRVTAGFLRELERLSSRADILSENMTFAGNPDAWREDFAAMDAATPGSVAGAARRWLSDPHYTLTVVPAPARSRAESPAVRRVVPDLRPADEASFPAIQRHVMPNGLTILLMERHTAPLVNVTLAVDAGFASDPEDSRGLSTLALSAMQEGTRTRGPFQMAEELDELGARLFAGNGLDLSFVRLRALTMNLAPSIDRLADVALNPAFEEEMVRLRARRQVAAIGQEKSQPVALALRLAPRLLFGEGHPYAAPLTGSGDASTVAAAGPEALAGWHRTWFLPAGATLIVAGDATLEGIVPLVEKSFGGWESGTSARKDLPASPPVGRKVFLIDRPGAIQSVIVAAHLSERAGQPDELAIEMVMRLFGGMSTSRLNRNLRLEKHWSYGVNAELVDARGQRPLVIVAPVQTDRTKEAMRELAAETRGIAGGRPVEGEEFESLRRHTVSRLAGRYETLASLEGAAAEMVAFGYPPEHFYEHGRRLLRLTSADLNAAAARYIRPDGLLWIVVGDLEKIEEGVRELDHGEVVRLDQEGTPARP